MSDTGCLKIGRKFKNKQVTTVNEATVAGAKMRDVGISLLRFPFLVTDIPDRGWCTVLNCNTAQNNVAISIPFLFSLARLKAE